MKEIIEKLKKLYAEMRTRANKALAGLEPIDQIQAARPVINALGEFEWAVDRMSEFGAALEEIPELLAAHEQQAIQAELNKRLEAGELSTSADVQAAIEAAKRTAEETVKAEWQKKLDDVTVLSERREVAVKAHGALAANISQDDLLAEDYEERLTLFAGRVTELQDAGITPEGAPAFFAELTALPLSEEGKASFDGRMAAISELAAGAKPGEGKTKKPAPKAPVVLKASSQDDPGEPVKDEEVVVL